MHGLHIGWCNAMVWLLADIIFLLLNSFIDFKENIQTFYRIIVAHNKVHEVKGKPGLTQHIEGFPVALQY